MKSESPDKREINKRQGLLKRLFDERGVLIFNVPAGDRAGYRRWLKSQEAEHGTQAWFNRAEQAVEDGDWDRAFRTAAAASVRSYAAAISRAKTPQQAAIEAAALAEVSTAEQDPTRAEGLRAVTNGSPSSSEPALVSAASVRTATSPLPSLDAVRSNPLRRMDHLVIAVAYVVGVSFVMLVTLFVWPTVYRYDHMELGGENGAGPAFPVRIQRFTGEAEILLPQGWSEAGTLASLSWVGSGGERLPAELIARLSQQVESSFSTGILDADVFNDTGWRITKVRFDVRSRRRDAVVTRQFDQPVFIEPNTRASIRLSLPFVDEDASAELREAWGIEIVR